MSTATPPAAAETADRLDIRRILPIFVVVLVDLLGLTIIIPLLPLYAATLRASPLLIGVLGATYPLMQLLAAPLLGRLSDRYGRKPVLLVSQVGTLIGFVVLGVADTIALLFLSRVIDGISGGNIATAQAMIADSTSERTRTQGLGLIGAAFGLGFIVGPLISFAALALSQNNYHLPALIAAACSALSIGLTWAWLPETHTPTEQAERSLGAAFAPGTLLRALRLPQIGLLLALMFGQQFAFGGFEQVLPLFTLSRLGLDASGNAGVFVYVGVIVVAIQGGLVGRWSRAWGDRRMIAIGLALLTLGLALLALTPAQPVPWYSRAEVLAGLRADSSGATQPLTLPDDGANGWLGLSWLLVALIPASVGGGILPPSINSLITRRAGAGQRGELLGSSAACASAANVLAPLFGGALFQLVSTSAPFACWTLLLVLLLVLTRRTLRPGAEQRVAGAA